MRCTISLNNFKTVHNLLESQKFTNINFVCNDGEIAAHHNVLAANIGEFQKSHDRKVIIALTEYSKKDVREFLELLYTGKGNFDDNVQVKKLLDKFQCNYSETHSTPSSPNLLSPNFNGNKKNKKYVVNPFSSKLSKSKSSCSKSPKTKRREHPNLVKSTPKPQNQNNSQQHQTKTNDIDDKQQIEIINELPQVARKRKNIQQSQASNNENQDGPSSSTVPKRKRLFNLNNLPLSPILSENSSDDNEIKVDEKLVEPIIVDSTDDEADAINVKTTEDNPSNISKESNPSSLQKAELEVMKYTSHNESLKKLRQYCFICNTFVPGPIKVHSKIHRSLKRPVMMCPYCSVKFKFGKLLPIHLRVCKKNK